MIENSIIGVDFDGTCVTHEFPEIGHDIGATEVLRELVDKGHKLILFTMRSDIENPASDNPLIVNKSGDYLTQAVNWFKEHNIPLYGVNINPTQHKWTTSPKCYCHLYIDDASIGVPLVRVSGKRPFVNWVKVRELLVDEGLL
jgi:hypothetical protein